MYTIHASATFLLPFLVFLQLYDSFIIPYFSSILSFFCPISGFNPQGVLSQSEANLPNYKPHLFFSYTHTGICCIHRLTNTHTHTHLYTLPLCFTHLSISTDTLTHRTHLPPFLPHCLFHSNKHTDTHTHTLRDAQHPSLPLSVTP